MLSLTVIHIVCTDSIGSCAIVGVAGAFSPFTARKEFLDIKLLVLDDNGTNHQGFGYFYF